MTVGDRIRSFRKSQNLTQKQLGELSGIAEPTIRRYELGKLNPKYETLSKIAAALGIPASSLLGISFKIRDKIQPRPSKKDAHLELDIDSDLLRTIHSLAQQDQIPLDEEVERLLMEYIEILSEDVTE